MTLDRMKIFGNLALTIVLSLAFVVLVNMVSNRRYARVDMTTEKVFELSPETITRVKNLKMDVTVYARPLPMRTYNPMQNEKLPAEAMGHAWYKFRQFMNEVTNASSRIFFRELSPNSDDDVEELSKLEKAGVSLEPNYICVTRKKGDETKWSSFHISDVAIGDMSTMKVVRFMGEDVLLKNLAIITRENELKVLYTIGHGEERMYDRAGGNATIYLHQIIAEKTENIKFEALNFAQNKVIPPCDAMMIINPQSPFRVEEVELLKAYMDNGGRMILLLGNADVNLDGLLERYHMRQKRNIIVTQRGGQVLLDFTFPPHEINGTGQQLPLVFPQPVTYLDVDKTENPQYVRTALAMSPQDSMVVTGTGDQQKVNPAGSVPVGYSIKTTDQSKTERFIVFCCPGIFSLGAAGYINMQYYRRDPGEIEASNPSVSHFLNCLRWILKKEEDIVKPKEITERPLTLDQNEARFLRWMTLAVAPAVAIALGIFVFLLRRK